MKFIFATMVILTALSAYAAEYTAGTKCPTAVNVKPIDNLKYEPGITADGYGVAPADEIPPALSEEDFKQVYMALEIPVSDYVAKDTLNLNAEETELMVGTIATDAESGEVTFNERDITTTEPTLSNPDCW